ncbi:MAG TPA: nucleotidyltransferase family protein [Solirubrobacterales bacterium]|nr:nucleotidyltransferase family protein [Solirubrobacterales bacterium]
MAWADWRSGEPDLGKAERGSLRLLPLLYLNLGPELAGDPDAGWLKDAYRASWTANQLSLKAGRRAIDALQAMGTDVLVLKGAALIGSAYDDPGARPMGDFDLAVPPERIGEAVRALREAGLTPIEGDPERLLAARHSLAFRDPDGREVDLHRGMLWRPGLDEEFWSASIEAEVAGARVRILDPADQLLHVCAHGAAWNPVHPVRWAADAFKILEAAKAGFAWDRLIAMAERGRLSLPLRDALSCLATELRAPVPGDALRELGAIPVSAAERRAHRAIARAPSSRRSTAMLWWFWERHRAESRLDGRRPTPAGLVRHLRDFWGLERASLVPGHAARRLLRRGARVQDESGRKAEGQDGGADSAAGLTAGRRRI